MTGEAPMVVRERTTGTWEVTALGIGTAVWYYGSGTWRCESCGSLHEPSNYCTHLEAVLSSNPTRCGWAGDDPFEGDCSDIACGTTRVDGVFTPVCPTHRHVADQSTQQNAESERRDE